VAAAAATQQNPIIAAVKAESSCTNRKHMVGEMQQKKKSKFDKSLSTRTKPVLLREKSLQ
jgi:hypothetical protein